MTITCWTITCWFLTAYLGVHVTLHPVESAPARRWYKIGFCGCGVCACVLIGVQAYRNAQAQAATQKQLTQIERNTKEPPRVEVNVPPPTVIQPLPNKDNHIMTTRELKDFGFSVVVEMEDLVKDVQWQWQSAKMIEHSINSDPKATGEGKQIASYSANRRRDEVRHKIKEKWITGLGERAEKLRQELAKRRIRDDMVDSWLPLISGIQQSPELLADLAKKLREMVERFDMATPERIRKLMEAH